ncbi:MAG: aldehyde dehydrogenase family protein [Candidatus Sumerlaeaceae bacterium]
MNESQIAAIVDEVVKTLKEHGLPGALQARAARTNGHSTAGMRGVFDTMDAACVAAWEAQKIYGEATLEQRKKVVAALRETAVSNRQDFAERELAETKLGRLDHKLMKLDGCAALTPGVEYLATQCWTGDHGLTVEELAPYGVIAAVTPVTHVVPTMVNNAISILAGGNTVVFNGHPGGKTVFAYALDKFNAAIERATGLQNLMTCIAEPTIESGKEMFNHPKVRVLLVTGGPGVVKEALKTPKKSITAGPGNPPVVVDETAVIPQAARDIIAGAGFDNNILCIGEKEVFVVEAIADKLMAELKKQGCAELNSTQIDELARKAFQTQGDVKNFKSCGGSMLNRDFVGKDAHFLARQIGVDVPQNCPMLIGETSADHLWVQSEQMMCFIPIVRCKDVDHAINLAVQAEHGYGHTAVIHSLNVANMTKMGKAMNVSLFIKNGPSYAGLGMGGEGHTSFSIASPTGEGATTCRTFCRLRRCTLVDYLRIV